MLELNTKKFLEKFAAFSFLKTFGTDQTRLFRVI